MNISVVGLGKLGSPFAASLAAKGHRVIGVDLNERAVALINQGKAPVFEPGLDDMITRAGSRLSATTDMTAAIQQTDVTFLVIPTPSEPNGVFSMKYALMAGKSVGTALQGKDGFHLVVLTSTVMPGDTGGKLLPALEQASGKCCGRDFGLCYSPEFIALGSVIHDMLTPDFLLIGESDPRSGDILAEVYRSFCDNSPPAFRMAFVNAELAKLAVNTFVTTKISYANMLAEICERLDGGNVDVVTAAIGRDSRIGSKYLKAALGYGGPCFPRDNVALAALASSLGVSATIAQATDRINHWQVSRLKTVVQSQLPAGGSVAVLGLSYKPKTNVVERSQGLELAQALLADGVAVSVYEPAPIANLTELLPGKLCVAGSAIECVQDVDVVVVCTTCDEFRAINTHPFTRNNKQPVTVIDCWRMLDRARLSKTARYLALGTSDFKQAHVATEQPPVRIKKAA
jgi:UDPglucose 6-dehydrogenase